MEYMDSYDKTDLLLEKEEFLLDEARSLQGMLAEVAAKGRLLKQQLDKEIEENPVGDPSESIFQRMDKLKVEFNRYAQRFDLVIEELRGIYEEIDELS